jgi:hypothetical protein
MFSLQQNQKKIGQNRFCLEAGRKVAQIMYAHVSKYKNGKINFFKKMNNAKRYHNIGLQIILQNHNMKNSMLVTQKQTQRPKEQHRSPRNKTTQLQPSDL